MDELKIRYAFMASIIPKSNGQRNRKEDVTQIKVSLCNILIVTNENECRNLFLIKDKMAMKPKKNSTKSYTQFSPQKLFLSWILLQYTSIEFLFNLIIGRFLANTTSVYFFFFVSNILDRFVPGRTHCHYPSTQTKNSTADFLHHQFGAIYGKF